MVKSVATAAWALKMTSFNKTGFTPAGCLRKYSCYTSDMYIQGRVEFHGDSCVVCIYYTAHSQFLKEPYS